MNVRVTNTHSDGTNKAALRVYLDGIKIVELFINTWSPKKYIKDHPDSRYRYIAVETMRRHRISDQVIFKELGLDGK